VTRDFGTVSVIGRKRVARPPARIATGILNNVLLNELRILRSGLQMTVLRYLAPG